MINLAQDTANYVYMNLTSNSDLFIYSSQTPYFLFEFISEATNENLYFVTENIAALSSRTRYDEFVITESGSTYTNLTGGTIHMNPGYFWIYNVYEQTTRDNLNPANTINIVSNGRVFFTPNITNGFISYSGQSTNIFFNQY